MAALFIYFRQRAVIVSDPLPGVPCVAVSGLIGTLIGFPGLGQEFCLSLLTAHVAP